MDLNTLIDDYISKFSGEVKNRLETIRQIIAEEAPDATEAMKYGIPTFVLNGNLVHFAGFKNHIGFYPTPAGIEAFKNEFAPYKTSKGAIQFPLDKPLPLDLLRRIVRFRIQENLKK